MEPRPSPVPPFVQSRHHLAPIGATGPNPAAACIAQPSSSFSPRGSPSLSSSLILFVGILVQAKPCGQGQMFQRLPRSHPSCRQPEVKEEVEITHNAWPDGLPCSPSTPT